MSFVSEQYYLKLCKQLFTQINNVSGYNPVDREVLRRDFVSRLYYTGFLHCTVTLGLDTSNVPESHNAVISRLVNEYRFNMIHLKKLRKDADYKMAPFPEQLKFKDSNVRLQRLIAVVEEILSTDSSTLSA